MYLYLVTPCGRYGKCHGEPFLRRRSTLEPMDVCSLSTNNSHSNINNRLLEDITRQKPIIRKGKFYLLLHGNGGGEKSLVMNKLAEVHGSS
jgi:hypothetical protein